MRYLILFIFLFLNGCVSTTYITPDTVTKYDSKFSDTDLKIFADYMVGSLIKTKFFEKEIKVIGIFHIKNKTSEHINTDSISDKIMIGLLKTGKVKFANREDLKKIIEEQRLSLTGMVDDKKVIEAGKLYGINYFLSGTLESIEKRGKTSELTYYRLSMKLTDTETGEIVWADEYEIKKKVTKHFMDW